MASKLIAEHDEDQTEHNQSEVDVTTERIGLGHPDHANPKA
ncbi:hypothetical protein [Breoghania sp.]|nr:hypothetical protein [Breoghania sp.]MDJ0933390.1 hypothetical protein [Breoghania sp.]